MDLAATPSDARKGNEQQQYEEGQGCFDEEGVRKEKPSAAAVDVTEDEGGAVASDEKDIDPAVEIGFRKKVVAGQIIKERRYTLTAAGAAAWNATRDFYVANIATFDADGGVARA